ncbi:STAS domain-containing protein [Streptomyces sp. NPDC102487]|uniref:STAS domain-containing protein n=1 Tax=Streptomyces sp. NPDC102487 TaxID=3366182 RepID=UPI0038246F80
MAIPDAPPTDIPVLTPSGDLDHATIAPFAEALEAASTQHHAVIVDLSRVTFGDSTFLNTLIHCHQLTDLRLAAVPEILLRIMEITGMHEVLRLYPNLEATQNPPSPASEASAAKKGLKRSEPGRERDSTG